MFEQNSTVPVHDALRPSRRPRREHDPQRVIEGHRQRDQLVVAGDRLDPVEHPRDALTDTGDGDRQPHAGQQFPQVRGICGVVPALAVEVVAVGGNQRGRLQLLEAGMRRGDGVVLPAAGPHGAQARRREKGDHRFRNIG